jgi:hypothetical protein
LHNTSRSSGGLSHRGLDYGRCHHPLVSIVRSLLLLSLLLLRDGGLSGASPLGPSSLVTCYQDGFGRFPVAQDNGRRCTAASSYLKAAKRRPNLAVKTQAQATKVTSVEGGCGHGDGDDDDDGGGGDVDALVGRLAVVVIIGVVMFVVLVLALMMLMMLMMLCAYRW